MDGNLIRKGFKSLKIALAALLAIALAGELGLQYALAAGIITVLSIQGTKLETLKTAGKRALAFLCALLIAGLCYQLLGYTLWAYAVYLFLFAMVCLVMNWPEAIAMDSVLIGHFLSQECFVPLLGNEILLFVIGTGFGIAVNLHLRSRKEAFTELSDQVDRQIKEILGDMAEQLAQEDESDGEETNGQETNSEEIDSEEIDGGRTGCGETAFAELKKALLRAEECAVANYGNAPFSRDTYELEYVRMRQQQTAVLQAIHDNIRGITYLPRQAGQVAELLRQIQQEYHRYNNVEGLLGQLQELLADMQRQPLPESREEFEARAALFYLLKQLEELLTIKKEFIRNRSAIRG